MGIYDIERVCAAITKSISAAARDRRYVLPRKTAGKLLICMLSVKNICQSLPNGRFFARTKNNKNFFQICIDKLYYMLYNIKKK